MKYLIYFFISYLTIGMCSEALSKVYKCYDSSGKTVYKNSPCSESQKSEVIIDTDSKSSDIDQTYYYENENYDHLYNDNVSAVELISSGERVNLDKHLVKNKITAFFFYADWCHACEKVKPRVEDMALGSDNFVIREVDITDFDSPVTQQFGIKAIPYFLVYDKSGELAVKGTTSSVLGYLNGKI